MSPLQHVPIEVMDPRRFSSVLAPSEYVAFEKLIAAGARDLRGRVIWNVNST